MPQHIIDITKPVNSQSGIQIDTPEGSVVLDKFEISESGAPIPRSTAIPTESLNGAQPSQDVFVPGSVFSMSSLPNVESDDFDKSYSLKIIDVPDINQGYAGTCLLMSELANIGGAMKSSGYIPEGYDLDITAFLRCNGLSDTGDYDHTTQTGKVSSPSFPFSTVHKLRKMAKQGHCFKMPILKKDHNCQQDARDDEFWGTECCATKSVKLIRRVPMKNWSYPSFATIKHEMDSGRPMMFGIGTSENSYIPGMTLAQSFQCIKYSSAIVASGSIREEEIKSQIQSHLLDEGTLTPQEIVELTNKLNTGNRGTLNLSDFSDKELNALQSYYRTWHSFTGHALVLHGYKYDPSTKRITLYIKNSWSAPTHITLSFDESESSMNLPFIKMGSQSPDLLLFDIGGNVNFDIVGCERSDVESECPDVSTCYINCYDCREDKAVKVQLDTSDAEPADYVITINGRSYSSTYTKAKCSENKYSHREDRAHYDCPHRKCYGCPGKNDPPYDPDKPETGCIERKIPWDCQAEHGFPRYCDDYEREDGCGDTMVSDDLEDCIKSRTKMSSDKEYKECYNNISISSLMHMLP